jgi:hypothetical protein
VTHRFILSIWLTLLLALAPLAAHAAEGIDVIEASVEATEEGYRLRTEFSLELTRSLDDALLRGVPLYFTTQIEITRPRWYWFDETAVSATRTVRISYNLLTRQYRASVDGNLHRNFAKLEDVLALLRRPSRWMIADLSALKRGELYQVSLQMGLDVALLPKPIQVSAISGGDWRLSSGWTRFQYKAEGK